MNEIWPELIQKTIEPPRTITETVDRLISVLDDEHKVAIAAYAAGRVNKFAFQFGVGDP